MRKKRCCLQPRPIGGEKRIGLPRRLEMKELSPERAIIHSWTERGSWIRRCTRARFRGMGGALRENSRLVISIAMEFTLDSQNRKIVYFWKKNLYLKFKTQCVTCSLLIFVRYQLQILLSFNINILNFK